MLKFSRMLNCAAETMFNSIEFWEMFNYDRNLLYKLYLHSYIFIQYDKPVQINFVHFNEMTDVFIYLFILELKQFCILIVFSSSFSSSQVQKFPFGSV